MNMGCCLDWKFPKAYQADNVDGTAMTRLPDVINQKINNAGAMEALAKGDEMTCIHEWDYSPDSADTLFTCLKCGTELYAVDTFNRLNILETNVARLRKDGEEYRAQLAARDALIERLVEAGEKACRDYEGFGYGIDNIFLTDKYIKPKSLPLEFSQDEFEDIVSEWKASKDGGGE